MIGDFVKKKRVEMKFTQEELAEKAKMNPTYLSKLERGQLITPPSEEVMFALAEALEEDPYELMVKAGRVPSEFIYLILNDENVYRYLKRKLEEQKKKG
ncbi:helix-turn-helix domain-containing protein [Paenibacillus hubeiensis]|uniref:helix-turn-helix domain-containing protein n=1 Tax=Paenibacillus hubeiensis TaxID=3077330 RepID=UPI0031B9D399